MHRNCPTVVRVAQWEWRGDGCCAEFLGAQLEPGSGATSEAQESCPRLGGHKGPESSHGSVNTGCSLGAAVAMGQLDSQGVVPPVCG